MAEGVIMIIALVVAILARYGDAFIFCVVAQTRVSR
jgi:hypothetical protein